jgi:hypothetical protein
MDVVPVLKHTPTNPIVDPVGCLSRGGNCRHAGGSLRVAGPTPADNRLNKWLPLPFGLEIWQRKQQQCGEQRRDHERQQKPRRIAPATISGNADDY